MSAFTELRARLAAARAERQTSTAQLTIARERLRDVQRELAELARVPGQAPRERAAELERRAAALAEQVDGLRRRVGGLKAGTGRLLDELVELADPSRQIGELSDSVPILLFPVRLETRFRPARPARAGRLTAAAVPQRPQLWIRIYPDDCQVDAFEALLTRDEVDNARAFWVAMWRAGGVEAQERGAWRVLVGAAGSGRAAYIVEQYQPVDPGARPTKVEPQDVVLVIVPREDATPAEQAAAVAYATAVWRADGDAAQESAALAALSAAVGAARADALRTGFAPEPDGQEPPAPYTRAQVRVSCGVLRLPPPPPTKTTSWSQAPRAVALPDRFVALLFNGETEVNRAVGRPIPDGLAVGPDPSLPPAEQLGKDGDDLALNEELRWLADFERAVSVGMGLVVDLTEAEAAAGFDRLLVVGLRFSADEHEGRQQVQDLVAHHHASRRGFGLVPQGSPTNNTESAGAAYTWVDDADAAYDVVFK
ncbi:MAG TPA: hypothetical protein VFX28_25540, partial [Methylomirabilota bacterium]|nr:hypothetical protein [Methylomirabilota bacterium]